MYDKYCKIIDDSTKSINLCGFKNGKCYAQNCKKTVYKNGCCRRCRYQNENGCPTTNLACKLFNCSEVKQSYRIQRFKNIKTAKSKK